MVTKAKRNLDWGFPRWRDYGAGGSAPATVRTCDRDGCEQPGDHPAPKAPNRPERWYFCERHAAEYNSGWNYFEGLSAEEAAAREADADGETQFKRASHWSWAGPGDGRRSRGERDALKARWESERGLVEKINEAKDLGEKLKFDAAQAER